MIAVLPSPPSVDSSTNVPDTRALPALMLPQDNQTDLALITPMATPRDTLSSSPISLTISNSNTLPIAIVNAALASAPLSRPCMSTEGDQKTTHVTVSPPSSPKVKRSCSSSSGIRLNKFVRRLHDMLQSEQCSGIVEWRRGLLVLHSTDAFAKTILPRYFNTRNFKTFRRQLNYYGFVHVRSFSTTGSTTTALWVNRDLAKHGTSSIASVLMLKRVEPCESAKTAEGRRVRKELAVSTVEDDIGVNAKSLQLEQIRSMVIQREVMDEGEASYSSEIPPHIPLVVHCHGIHSTTTTFEGSKPQLSLLPKASGIWSNTSQDHEGPQVSDGSDSMSSADCDEDNKSAANLLIMLSQAAVRPSALIGM